VHWQRGEALSRSDSLSHPGLRQKQLRQTTNIEACKGADGRYERKVGKGMRKKLPIGIQSFEKLRTENFAYVDKTPFIYQLVHENVS